MMNRLQRYSLIVGFISLFAFIISIVLRWDMIVSALAVASSILLTFGIGSIRILKSYQYTGWIIVAIVCGLIYPSAFLKWGDIDLRNKWLILIVIQLVMFGMGTQMSLKDFTGIKTMSKGVLVGIICQFSIMPLIGYILTRIFDFEPEIAAGIILIGSCSSGLASNVMVFLARANLTLSVTLTAVATLLAPVMTPFLMKILAGTYVEIKFMDMCIQIIKIVIVPIGAAMLNDAYTHGTSLIRKYINIIFYVSLAWIGLMLTGMWNLMESHLSNELMQVIELINFLFGAVIVGKLYFHGMKLLPKVHQFMPKISMFGIVYFTVVTTAASRENILTIGIFMLLASMLHNSLGYIFGYWISRGLGLDKESCKTVALEVGLQNGGMATGLAGVMGKLATMGLASAIFSPWMNISGSVLANYWRKKKIKASAASTE